MLSITATAASQSEEPITVGLSSPTGSFGIRDVVTGYRLKPAGTNLSEYSDEHWKLETQDAFPGAIYEYWLKFKSGKQVFYVPSYGCSLASTDPVGSLSEPEPEGERSIRIKREQTPVENYRATRGDSARIRLTVTEAVGMSPNVFGHLNRDAGPDFCFIVSPFDGDIYPVDTPDVNQNPPFYLKSQIDVIVPSPAAADTLYENVVKELGILIDSMNRHDVLSEENTQQIE